MNAHLAIQCRDATGALGSFLFEPESRPFAAVSPVMPDLVALFGWMDANGWAFAGCSADAPCGIYVKAKERA